jgi:hypothetical protein
MRSRTALAWLVAVLAGACFSEPFAYDCDRGEKGCSCNGGLCLVGLECKEDHCVVPGCTRGDAFCNCDDGDCNAHLRCWEGAVCVPEDGSEGTAGSSDPTAASATGSGDVTSAGSSDVSSDGSESDACSCGPCERCDSGGACEPDVGAACDGEMLECADFLWGYEEGSCFRFASTTLPSTCDATGACRAATPQDCPARKGDALVECDVGCVSAPELCDSYDPAASVSLETMCVVGGTAPGCTQVCYDGSGSSERYLQCDGFGHCQQIGMADCMGYSCDGDSCRTSCADQPDCAQFYSCAMSVCTPD